ncbi:branched-chain amino acid transport system ATP-binding protein [Meinhardsimonia xiamenensis]|jgi:branched-chain amino acid transport system ATP-binding protein|uniref:Branched-chain amino acid transport system ATP-binding protein n=1 Tax=Meinhardsimonia xiamenensis TaxID=990712 RepID=A0A1G9CYM9_9RHOB|nr:ABC transporter ATP-binding protein [Meinhardsimonia xiamenensis]PRX38195.1 amino acid/amide ABC transporter ATP-binding protein 2 (HAAT family) [Meinhardsimonia xiamenensis]SDK56778.1 branched-chain amino acid transport system ATP-binding protein [Meinhardsimonia xiamenensis]
MLRIEAVDAGYGRAQVLRRFSLEVAAGEVLCLLGRNGAGKTTLMRAIMGHLPLMGGAIRLEGVELSALPPHEVPRQGVGYVPQGRRLFGDLTVAQNLAIGLMARGQGEETREWVLGLFPRLRERLGQRARTLSGGEQQMLATARALCLRPRLLLMDEPTEGLQPSMIEAIRQVVARMRDEGVGILLVEQRIDAVLAIADRVAFIENGRGGEVVPAEQLRRDHALVERYLGV